jgi:hypothetical protein
MITSVRRYWFPDEIAAFDHFADASYVNDVTDSVVLAAGDRPLTVWIDHADPEERHEEFRWLHGTDVDSGPPARFVVCRLVDSDPDRVHRTGAPTLRDLVHERYLADGAPLFETEDPDALVAYLRGLDHENAGGDLCTDDGTGTCGVCGVALTKCDACDGIGYHRELCPESDAADREERGP